VILPDQRVAAIYGAPRSESLGVLGFGTPKDVTEILLNQAAPEWIIGAGLPPGEQVDRIGAEDVNAVASYLSDLVRRFHLPQKLLIVHEPAIDTIIRPDRLQGVDGVALVLDTDGSAAIPDKAARYRARQEHPAAIQRDPSVPQAGPGAHGAERCSAPAASPGPGRVPVGANPMRRAHRGKDRPTWGAGRPILTTRPSRPVVRLGRASSQALERRGSRASSPERRASTAASRFPAARSSSPISRQHEASCWRAPSLPNCVAAS
jgi:hypothetical protein